MNPLRRNGVLRLGCDREALYHGRAYVLRVSKTEHGCNERV